MSAPSLHAIVFGPFKSPRHGATLGINPVPTDRGECPTDCPICQYGIPDTVPILTRALQRPTSGVVVTSAARHIIDLSKGGEKVATILVAGVDDPTNHNRLLEVSENLRTLRNKWFPKASLTLLTRGEGLALPDNSRALLIYDKPIVRFEWGLAKTFTAMTGRPGTGLKELTAGLKNVDKLIVEATFVRGGPDNSTDAEVKAWIKRVSDLGPKEVQIGTLAGAKRGAKVKPITPTRLEQISTQLADETGLAVTVLELEPAAV